MPTLNEAAGRPETFPKIICVEEPDVTVAAEKLTVLGSRYKPFTVDVP